MNDVAEHWQRWIGRSQEDSDVIDPVRARALQATLDDPAAPLAAGDALPQLWHWIYFWSFAPHASLGPDGHAARGGFLPPINLPRRMWAGCRAEFIRPLKIGAEALRRTTLSKIQRKQGSSGQLIFVTMDHEYADAEGVCIKEAQDIVFREAARPGEKLDAGERAPAVLPWRRKVAADPILLFRYSALTFNGHRIHYDHKYTTEVEGYPGVVVHGSLLATLMMELAREKVTDRPIRSFVCRALRPVFHPSDFSVGGRLAPDKESAQLWVADSHGYFAMQARADLG